MLPRPVVPLLCEIGSKGASPLATYARSCGRLLNFTWWLWRISCISWLDLDVVRACFLDGSCVFVYAKVHGPHSVGVKLEEEEDKNSRSILYLPLETTTDIVDNTLYTLKGKEGCRVVAQSMWKRWKGDAWEVSIIFLCFCAFRCPTNNGVGDKSVFSWVLWLE